jgi:periplasmic divalent cation tolerance protein
MLAAKLFRRGERPFDRWIAGAVLAFAVLARRGVNRRCHSDNIGRCGGKCELPQIIEGVLMAATHAVLLTTCADRDSAKALAHALVERRLAACVQMLPIDSVYAWEGKIEEAAEILLLCKIKRDDYPAAEAVLRALHAYTTPEIVMLEIAAGAAPYLAWIDAVTKRGAGAV